MFDITTKLEINVSTRDAVDVQDLIATAVKARVSAIVVENPEFIPQLQFMRMSTGGQFRIILAVDFAAMGKNFALAKFRTLHPSWMDAEGYDILLSPRQSPMEIKNEIGAISTHLRSLNPVCELRFCINALNFSREVTGNMIKFIQQQSNPRPTLIRMDQNLQMPGRVASEYAPKFLQLIRAVCPLGVKVSTNVTLEDIRLLKGQIAKFDVSLRDVKHIMHQLKQEAMAPAVTAEEEVTFVAAQDPEIQEMNERDEYNPPADLGLAEEHVVAAEPCCPEETTPCCPEETTPCCQGEPDAPQEKVIDLDEVSDAPTTTTSSGSSYNVTLSFNDDGSLASPVVEEVTESPFIDPIEGGRLSVPELEGRWGSPDAIDEPKAE